VAKDIEFILMPQQYLFLFIAKQHSEQ